MRPFRSLARLTAIALVVLLGACSSSSPSPESPTTAAPTSASTSTNALQSVFDGVLEEHHMPQGVAAVSVPGVDPWEGSYSATGFPGDAADPLNRYPIRSVTKSFTVTLVLMLAKNKEVSMKDPISAYVDGVPNGDTITLSELAAMRSGLPDYTANDEVLKVLRTDPEHQWTTPELLDYAYELGPNFPPGTQHEYSNTNTMLLGQVVERITGAPLREAYDTMIWEPLDLIQTTYPDNADIPTPHLPPYFVDPETGDHEEAPTLNLSSLGASGGMVSSVRDLAIWATALGDGSLIGRRLQKQRLASFGPIETGPTYDEYGWGIGKIDGWIGHTGQGFGYQAAVFYRPEDGATIVVLLNASQDLNIAEEAFKALAAAAPAPLEGAAPPKPSPLETTAAPTSGP